MTLLHRTQRQNTPQRDGGKGGGVEGRGSGADGGGGDGGGVEGGVEGGDACAGTWVGGEARRVLGGECHDTHSSQLNASA